VPGTSKAMGNRGNLYVNDFQRYPLAGSVDANGQAKLAEELIGAYFGGNESVDRIFSIRCTEKWPGEGLRYYYNDFARTSAFLRT
jgi:hypothetical protein